MVNIDGFRHTPIKPKQFTIRKDKTKTLASHDFDVFWCTLPIRSIFIGQIVYPLRNDPPRKFRELIRFYVCMSVSCRYLLVKSGAANVLIFSAICLYLSRKRDVYRRFPDFRQKTAFETPRRDGG